MAVLLDTDTCVELINGRLSPDRFLGIGDVAISSITAYELAVGAEKSAHKRTKDETFAFLDAVESLEFDRAASAESARVRAELEREGRGIGPYDTLIAGHCRVLGYTLKTRNLREFSRVRGLTVEQPWNDRVNRLS